MARVVIENLSKIFKGPGGEPVWALRDVNLTVEDKEFVVLVGPSGCGKSTTLRLIAGLEEISQGTISINGQVVNRVAPQNRDLAMVFQNYALFPHLTVYDNMALGLKLRKIPKPEIQQRVRHAAEILGLTLCLDRKPSALSGGERQRVAVGRAIVRQPKVFLFDEPLSNLDPQMRAQMRVELSRLHRRLQATIIYVTHDQVEAMTMGDRIAAMKEGVIQQVADPLGLYHRPANLFVAGFIGSPAMNFFHGTLLQKGEGLCFVENSAGQSRAMILRVIEEHARLLQAYAGKQIVLGLRPENIHLAANTSSLNRVAAWVEVVEPMGLETHVHFTSGAHTFIARIPAGEKVKVPQSLPLDFDMQQAHFFDAASQAAIGTAMTSASSSISSMQMKRGFDAA